MYRTNPLSDGRKKLIVERLSAVYEPDEVDWLITQILLADPTPTGNSALWVANLIASKNVFMPEDIDKIREALKQFETLKNKNKLVSEDRNIFKFKRFGDLAARLEMYSGDSPLTPEKAESTSSNEDKIAWEQGPWKLVELHKKEDLVKASDHTKWCTINPDYAQYYLDIGRVFIIYYKNKKYGMGFAPNYNSIYVKYLDVVQRVEAMLAAGIDPITGQKATTVERPELQKLFPALMPELIPMASTHTWYEWRSLLKSFRFVDDFFKELGRRINGGMPLQESAIQIRDVQDLDVPYSVHQRIFPVLKQFNYPQATDISWTFRDYYRDFSWKKDPRMEKLLLSTQDPTKLVDYVLEVGRTAQASFYDIPRRGGRWKSAERYIWKDVEQAKRYYELIQHQLSRAEQKQFETRLSKAHHREAFTWPGQHYLELAARLLVEEDLQVEEEELRHYEAGLKKTANEPLKQWTAYLGEGAQDKEEQYQQKISLEELRRHQNVFKAHINKLYKLVAKIRNNWQQFKETVSRWLDAGEVNQELLYKITDLHKKLFSKIEKELAPRGYVHSYTDMFGPKASEVFSFKKEFPYFSTRHTLETLVEDLVTASTPFGMVKLGNAWVTPTTFLKAVYHRGKQKPLAGSDAIMANALAKTKKTKRRRQLAQKEHLDGLASWVNREFASIKHA